MTENKYTKIREILDESHVKPSINRIKIFEYLMNNKSHPTVDEVYKSLKGELPTLSKATVYNSFKAFLDAGIVKAINLEGQEARFDYKTEGHGHFKCEKCEKIYDFDIMLEDKVSEELKGFSIKETEVLIKGICKDCINSSKQ